jgi:hypothetical protein
MINFTELTTKELLTYWNSYEGTKPIKKFRDRATAVRRCRELGDLVHAIESTGRTPKRTTPVALELVQKPADVPHNKYARLPATPERKRNMSDSLRLDRTIYVTNEAGKEWYFNNTHAMWRERPDWMSGAQVDRITRVLYTAAKQGIRTSVELNGRTFQMQYVEDLVLSVEG